MMDGLLPYLGWLPAELQYLVLTLIKIVAILIPLFIIVAYYTFAERKVIGYMQIRRGPNRIGPLGLFQPFADVLKLLLKEIILPENANKFLFLLAPVLALAPAFAAWAVVPFDDWAVLADIDAGLIYILAMSSLGVYGLIIAGWASNSKYAFLGALRSTAQMVSYEIAMGFALIGVLIMAGSLNLREIVLAQQGGVLFKVFGKAVLELNCRSRRFGKEADHRSRERVRVVHLLVRVRPDDSAETRERARARIEIFL